MTNIKFELPLTQLCTIPAWPVTGSQQEEISLLHAARQRIEEHLKVLPLLSDQTWRPPPVAELLELWNLHAFHLCPLESMHRGGGC